VATDARRKEVYWAHYDNIGGQPQRLHGPFVNAAPDVTELPVFGAGAGLYPQELFGIAGFTDAVADASDIAAHGTIALRPGRGPHPHEPQHVPPHGAKVPEQPRSCPSQHTYHDRPATSCGPGPKKTLRRCRSSMPWYSVQ